jgi:hypothetical protein
MIFWVMQADAKDFDFTNDQIADAIYIAEGGAKTAYPYGILRHYRFTKPREACINTIKSARKRFAKQRKENDFIHFLSLTYCPVSADPLNANWERLVKFYLEKNK